MARKQLINLHSSQVKNPSSSTISPEIAVGEIVIQAVKTAATIYTKVGTNDFAEFIDKTQIQSLISSASSSLSDRVDALATGLTELSGTVETIEPWAESALQSISAAGANDYVSASAAAKTGDNGNMSQAITVTANVAGDISAATNDNKLADAYKVKEYVDAEVADEAQLRSDADTALDNKITALTETVDYALSGLTIDSTHSVKTYIDTVTGSVYKVKGTVPNADSLPSEKSQGDVYNITDASSYGPAGTNVVWDGSQWDALGGTWDLSPYAYASALTNEISARGDADAAINAKIGGSYSSSSTVASAVEAAQTAADGKLATISASGDDYVSASAGSVSGDAGSKSQAISVASNVATDLQSVASTDKKLADAYAVKSAINAATAETKNVDDKVTLLKNDVTALTETVGQLTGTSLTHVTAEGDDYITLSTGKTGTIVSISAETQVATNIATVTSEDKYLADAYAVQQYVDTKVGAATAATSNVSDRVTTLEQKVGSNSAYSSAHTISDAVAALESGAVTGATATGISGVTASVNNNVVDYDFSDIVIDCGEY